MAYSDDGLVEAVYLPDKKYVIGYQWHSEMIYKKVMIILKLFKDFVIIAKNNYKNYKKL